MNDPMEWPYTDRRTGLTVWLTTAEYYAERPRYDRQEGRAGREKTGQAERDLTITLTDAELGVALFALEQGSIIIDGIAVEKIAKGVA